MSGRQWLWAVGLVATAASIACSDSTGPSTPLQKKASLATPGGAAFGRYILISGVSTCVEGCDDGDPGQKLQGIPNAGPDTSSSIALPADSLSGF